MEEKMRVLFLCTGNSCRSQMAEAFLREMAGDRFEVSSAGLAPKPVNPLAVKVMGEVGIDMSAHKSTDLRDLLGRRPYDYIIFVCSHAQQHCPTIYPSFGEQMYWPFDDPDAFQGSEGARLVKFREVRDLIADRLREWVNDLSKPGN